MAFNITAAGRVAAIAQRRDTVTEAFELAMTYIEGGYESVQVEDVETKEVFTSREIALAAHRARRQSDHA